MARKKDTEAELAEEAEVGEPRVYELGFHLDPELPSEEAKKAYQAVRALVASKGALVAEGEPEKIRLAYTISRTEVGGRRDFDSAYFSWIVYEAGAPEHAEIVAAATTNARIIRFIDLLTDKEAARHAAELREIAAKARTSEEEPQAEDPDAVIDAALDAALEGVVT